MTDTALDNGAGMTKPASYGDAPLPRRNGYRGMLPGSWLGREVRVAYVDCYGAGCESSGKLLDHFAFGIALNLGGGRTLLSWDSVKLIELAGD